MTKYLAVDYGLERTGLAISDPDGRMAFPLLTLTLKACGTRKALMDELARVARQNGAQAIVMGLPLHDDGSESETSIQIRNAAGSIRRRLPLPFYWMPEYLSSAYAESCLRAARIPHKRLKGALDQYAACAILDSFLGLPEARRLSA